jgi:hypothetical protein
MKNLLKKISDKFEFHFGWFFVNGMKHEKWQEKMKEKYGK